MKRLSSILGNFQWLDGGAMFGNAPKAIWSKWHTPNEKNQIQLATRALLIQDDNRNILLEAGIGAFFSPNLKKRYGVYENDHILLKSLHKIGLEHSDIDFVILSHLHFDHVGGLLNVWQESEKYELLFPKAKYIISSAAWERANNPHPRDKASFIPELMQLLKKSDRILLVDDKSLDILGNDYTFYYSNGHTPGLLHTQINMPKGPVIFSSDLIPGTSWIHLPITMGYDRSPELLVDEKKQFLDRCIAQKTRVFYTHDLKTEMSNIEQDTSGRYRAQNCLSSVCQLTE